MRGPVVARRGRPDGDQRVGVEALADKKQGPYNVLHDPRVPAVAPALIEPPSSNSDGAEPAALALTLPKVARIKIKSP